MVTDMSDATINKKVTQIHIYIIFVSGESLMQENITSDIQKFKMT